MLVTIPIETKRRELIGKTWLAYHLVLRGHSVAIGPDYEIMTKLSQLQPKIHIEHKGYTPCLARAGVKSFSLPTEGAVMRRNRYHPGASEQLPHLHAFLAWGPMQASEVRKQTRYPQRVVVAGNPRFDIYNSEFRGIYERFAESLRKKYADYVLINTNFTHVNNKSKRVLRRFGYNMNSDHVKFQQILLEGMCEFAVMLVAETDMNVVIRPHPSENYDTYQTLAKYHKNIFVEDSGDVFGWILGANCVVHNSCTTGVQAAMAGTPVIAYTPPGPEDYEAEIANAVSRRATTPHEVVESVREVLADEWAPVVGVEDRLKKEFANLEHDAAPFIAGLVDDISPQPEVDYTGVDTPIFKNMKAWVKGSRMLRHVIGPAARVFPHPRLVAITYGYQKFPGLSTDELVAILDGFTVKDPLSYHIEPVARCVDTYVITPSEDKISNR
jgi:surface carbohydrate biosynthesis protein